jgi:hypothetical protein
MEAVLKKFSGIDLHSNNSVVVVTDEADRILYQHRLPNELPLILQALGPHREELVGVVVESTYNWYWLVDGLIAAGRKAKATRRTAMSICPGLLWRPRTVRCAAARRPSASMNARSVSATRRSRAKRWPTSSRVRIFTSYAWASLLRCSDVFPEVRRWAVHAPRKPGVSVHGHPLVGTKQCFVARHHRAPVPAVALDRVRFMPLGRAQRDGQLIYVRARF